MAAPGSTVSSRTTAPPRSAPADSGVWFVVGFTQKGPTTPQTLRNIDDYGSLYGDRVGYGLLYDALDTFFKEGGSEAIVARAVGPTPVLATADLFDQAGSTGSDRSLIATASSYGDWGNKLNVAVIAPLTAGYRIQVTHDDLGTLETSPDLADQASAVTWAAASSYIRLAVGVSAENPRVQGPTSLATGTDDHANATDTHWLNALNVFAKALGPGQVSMPGRTTGASHANLVAHATANNRVAVVDLADTSDRATLVTAAGTDRLVSGSDSASGFAPWAIVPGVLAGVPRTVPYSAIEAGIMARNDSAGVTPNQPSAGERFGVSRYAIGLSQADWSDSDRDLLNKAGVNVARILKGQVTTYGYRTLADPTSASTLLLLSNRRLVMEIRAKAQAIGDSYVFMLIDGKRHLFGDYAGDLSAMLEPYWNDGSLFGDTIADAFTVDTGPNVNTQTTIAALQLKAILALSLSPDAEQVVTEVVSTALTQEVTS